MIDFNRSPPSLQMVKMRGDHVRTEPDVVDAFKSLRRFMMVRRPRLIQLDLSATHELASIFFWELAVFARCMQRRCAEVVVVGLRDTYLTDHHRHALRLCLLNRLFDYHARVRT